MRAGISTLVPQIDEEKKHIKARKNVTSSYKKGV